MTEEHENPYRCETCDKRRTDDCPVIKITIAGFHDKEEQEGFAWDITALVGCTSHSAITTRQQEQSPHKCHTCRTLQWDNRLIWSLEDLLAWVRANHTDQHDIRDHIDLMLGKYRGELEARQQETKFCTNMGRKCPFWNGLECIHDVNDGEPDCFYWLDEHDATIRNAAFIEARNMVSNRVIYAMCPFDGDCGQCFLCDNAGGCIVHSEKDLKAIAQAAREGERKKILGDISKWRKEMEAKGNEGDISACAAWLEEDVFLLSLGILATSEQKGDAPL